jgi:hypothetical protein
MSDFRGQFRISLAQSCEQNVFTFFGKTHKPNVKSDSRVNEPLVQAKLKSIEGTGSSVKTLILYLLSACKFEP